MYIVLEIQRNADNTVGTLIYSYENQNQAESKYHEVLSYAAVSKVPSHTAVLLTEDGYKLASQNYIHEDSAE